MPSFIVAAACEQIVDVLEAVVIQHCLPRRKNVKKSVYPVCKVRYINVQDFAAATVVSTKIESVHRLEIFAVRRRKQRILVSMVRIGPEKTKV